MKSYAPAAMAAIQAGQFLASGAVLIAADPAVRLWGGYGDLTLDGQVFKGIGQRGLVSVTAGALGGAEQSTELKVSGLDPDTAGALSLTDYRRVRVVLWRLIFDAAGANLLDAQVYLRGRIDQITQEEEPDGSASIKATVEGAARGLGRRGGRMRADADQRLISSTDGGFKHVSYAGERTLYWGGRRPVTVRSGLPGASGPGVGGSGGGRTGWRGDVDLV